MISAVMVAMAQKGKRRGRPKPNKVPLHLRMDLNDPDVFGEPAPSMLYHYTNAAGLTGIVQSKCRLQATDHQLLNDSDEFKFGRAIAMEVLESLDAVESNVKEKATAELADLLREPSFVAWLSTSHEILPQWRLYANETAGYCLGFNDLKSAAYQDDEGNYPLTYDLYRCWYEEAEFRQRLVERFARQVERFKGRRTAEDAKYFAQHLALIAWRYSQLGKHEHFKFESEWRFVVRAPEEFIRYRLGPRGLTPYLLTESLRLAEVWVGPGVGPTPEKACETVTEFLARYELSATVHPWKTSYRR